MIINRICNAVQFCWVVVQSKCLNLRLTRALIRKQFAEWKKERRGTLRNYTILHILYTLHYYVRVCAYMRGHWTWQECGVVPARASGAGQMNLRRLREVYLSLSFIRSPDYRLMDDDKRRQKVHVSPPLIIYYIFYIKKIVCASTSTLRFLQKKKKKLYIFFESCCRLLLSLSLSLWHLPSLSTASRVH